MSNTTQENYEAFVDGYTLLLATTLVPDYDTVVVKAWEAVMSEARVQGVPPEVILAWFREAYEQGGLEVHAIGSTGLRADFANRHDALTIRIRT